MKKKKIFSLLKFVFLVGVTIVMLFPIIYIIVNSFMSTNEIQLAYPEEGFAYLHLIPDKITLDQYYFSLFRSSEYLQKFWNSVILTVPIVLGQVVICTLGAYGFAKFEFPGRDKIFFVFIVLLVLPPQATMVSNYIVLDKLGLIGNNLSVILPGMFSAFGICLLRQYMRYIPDTCCEAAEIDGASPFRIFMSIIVPQSKAGIGTLVILSFIDNWNMIEQPLVMLKDEAKMPMSVMLSKVSEFDAGIAFGFSVIFLIPAIVIYLLFEDDLVQGLTF